MNTRKGRAKFKNFQIILDSVCTSTILMVRIIQKLHPKEDNVIQWHTQAGIITTNTNVRIDFTLSRLISTKIMIWNCHVDESSHGRYEMILGRNILTALLLSLK